MTWVRAQAPQGTSFAAADDTVAIHVRDRRLWDEQRRMRPAGSFGPGIYAVPRDLLFGSAPARERTGIIGLKPWLKRLLGRDEE